MQTGGLRSGLIEAFKTALLSQGGVSCLVKVGPGMMDKNRQIQFNQDNTQLGGCVHQIQEVAISNGPASFFMRRVKELQGEYHRQIEPFIKLRVGIMPDSITMIEGDPDSVEYHYSDKSQALMDEIDKYIGDIRDHYQSLVQNFPPRGKI